MSLLKLKYAVKCKHFGNQFCNELYETRLVIMYFDNNQNLFESLKKLQEKKNKSQKNLKLKKGLSLKLNKC